MNPTDNLKYVIYARKSTDDSEKQVRSIDDQIKDCEKLAINYGLRVVGPPIIEHRSAKKPRNREKFTQMIKDIKSRKIDGIISWHPDRLARNMVEAGEIIHLLDTEVMKDLKFHSHQFSNDPNGKMLLGMLFVFAKHYSDDLSKKVTRGVHGNLDEGKTVGTPKHGYIRHDDGIYRPDGDNFTLIQEAWSMRAKGKSIEEITQYLQSNNYTKYLKKEDKHIPVKLSKSVFTNLFSDTLYFGVLNQNKQTVDLRELGIEFTPMITEEIYFKVQEFTRKRKRGPTKQRALFLPLRDLVYCGFCDHDKPMSVSRSLGGNNKYVLYFTCKNKQCNRNIRNIRGGIVFKEIQKVLKNNLNITSKAYDEYLEDIKLYSGKKQESVRTKISSDRAYISGLTNKQKDKILALSKLTDKRAIEMTQNEIADLSIDIERLEADIEKKKTKLKLGEVNKISKDEFFNLMDKADIKLSKADKFRKDTIVRNMFSKLYFSDDKLVDYIWREPFLTLSKITDFRHGRGERT